ncbi:MAG: hypothetical protein M3N46_14630, partial [Actinomycetota bacterium]|nr:hypothetical protein [Actinomycetota bacterium]
MPDNDVEVLSVDFSAIAEGARRKDPLVLAILLIRELSERTPLLVALPVEEELRKGEHVRVRYG